MTTVVPLAEAAARLRTDLGDHVLLAGEPGYDDASRPWNVLHEQRPLAVAVPSSDDEVAALVRAASAAGIRVAAQSTGHGSGALSGTDLSDVLLVSLRNMRGVTVDPDARVATVRGGSLWHDVLEAAAPHGLTGLHGSAGGISVAGYALSGGISFYGRRHGMGVNAVRGVRMVTADGELVTATADENPDLFWAVRGGSGAFGVVVSLDIDLLPYPDVFAGMMLWDAARAAEVGTAWLEWTATVPESVTTALRVMHFPPMPELPPFLRGRSVVLVDGALLEADADADALLARLRALQPEMDTFARIPAARMVDVHMDPPEPSPAVSATAMLQSLDAEAIAAFVAAAQRARPMMSEIRHVGGAIARRPEHAGAVGAVAGRYLLDSIAIVPAPGLRAPATEAVRAVVAALAPWHGDEIALTFIDDGVQDRRPGFRASARRLAQLKERFDPENMFAAGHPVA
ncbi:FAD-binding oxidoreductase [Microbacterium kribbense]|uniref:FAD-binding oxidoreductase n=1 Tax=Microbacterium kribbense TaxID=433645 RepID=A0ABP7G829_9MICO